MFYDEPEQMEDGLRASWDAVRDGLADGAEGADAPGLAASTLPELLQDRSATAFIERGVPAVAGLRTALACAAALRRPLGRPGQAARDRRRRPRRGARPASAGRVALGGRRQGAARGARDRRAARARRRGRGRRGARRRGDRRAGRGQGLVARRCSTRARPARSCSAWPARPPSAPPTPAVAAAGHDVLVEAMAAPGVELLVAARRDAVVPALVLGLGGVWTELLERRRDRAAARRRPSASRPRCARCAARRC